MEQMILDAMLDDYNLLNHELADLREDQLWKLLEREMETRQRPSFVKRIHQRCCTVRTARERAELMEKLV